MSRTEVSFNGRRTHERPAEAARARARGSRREVSSGDEDAVGVDCAIIVITRNSAADLARLLDSIDATGPGRRSDVIVVDNASTDETVDVARAAGVRCLPQNKNLGYAAAINVGRRVCGEHAALLVLNPDVVLEPDCLRKLTDALADSRVGIVVPRLVDRRGHRSDCLRREPTLLRALGDCLFGGRVRARPSFLSEIVWHDKAYRSPHAVDWATGAVMLISAQCDAAVGPWDESFFLYSEEIDYCSRGRALGFEVRYVPDAVAQHDEGGSGGRADALVALMAINRIRYFESRHARSAAELFRAVVALHELLRARDFAHRRAFFTVLNRSRWIEVPKLLKTPR